MMRKFPSPCGDYGSYRGHKKHTPLKILNCFRPLAGIMVLIIEDGESYYYPDWLEFPSPCGDYGSYQTRTDEYGTTISSFRPLAGIMVLITARPTMNNRKRPKGVSVPLRGLWFLSADANGKGRERLAWFPSPCGDYGSYQFY